MERSRVMLIKIKANHNSFIIWLHIAYTGWTEAAQLITSAVREDIKADIFTADFGIWKPAYSTSAFSNQILSDMWLFYQIGNDWKHHEKFSENVVNN